MHQFLPKSLEYSYPLRTKFVEKTICRSPYNKEIQNTGSLLGKEINNCSKENSFDGFPHIAFVPQIMFLHVIETFFLMLNLGWKSKV